MSWRKTQKNRWLLLPRVWCRMGDEAIPEDIALIAHNRTLLALPCLAVLTAFVAAGEPSKMKPVSGSTGLLNLEGQAIQRMVLVRKGVENPSGPRNLIVLDRPGRSVSVPAGEYWLQAVELDGDYSCFLPRQIGDWFTGEERDGEWLAISPEKPCWLKIGGPLKPTVLAIRQGRAVEFGCPLFDANGRQYERRNTKSPPRFTISCDGQVVASGSFEYG